MSLITYTVVDYAFNLFLSTTLQGLHLLFL